MAVVRNVKTILQVEKEVDLATFYYPTKIETNDSNTTTIRDLDDLAYSGNTLFQGTVGQGKSIFFRYLASRELVKGKAIPVFVELRRIRQGQSFLGFLLAELGNLGLDMEEEFFRTLCDAGKVILFLDGFDEVSETNRSTVLSQIEDLWKRHEHNLRRTDLSGSSVGDWGWKFTWISKVCGELTRSEWGRQEEDKVVPSTLDFWLSPRRRYHRATIIITPYSVWGYPAQ